MPGQFRKTQDPSRSREGVKSAQVRAAVALAQQLIGAGRTEEADRLLRPQVIAAGDESSPDLLVARSLLR